MRTAMRPRYYCDHCRKGNGSPSAMRRHESGCTKNPNRVCQMCDQYGQNSSPAELVAILDERGFSALLEATDGCPACVLSALRQRSYMDEETGVLCVDGPDDGRNEWRYQTAKAAWWEAVNDEKREVELNRC